MIGADLTALSYKTRLTALLAAGIGLWDVIASAERAGSLDAAIRRPDDADLHGLIVGLPNLRAIGFNGKTAAKAGRRILGAPQNLALIDLPSSSPAFTLSLAQKAEAWAALAQWIIPSPPPRTRDRN